MVYNESINGLELNLSDLKEKAQKQYDIYRKRTLDLQTAFPDDYELIERSLNLVASLDNSIFKFCGLDHSNSTLVSIKNLLDRINLIINFNPLASDRAPSELMREHVEQLLVRFNDTTSKLAPMIAMQKLTSPEEVIQDVLDKTTGYSREIMEMKEQASQALSAIKDSSSAIGATKFASIFQLEAESYKKKGWAWMVALVAILVGSAIGGIVVLASISIEGKTPGEVVYSIATKAFLFSIAYIFIAMTSKNYNAAEHNRVVNQHRSNALTVFEKLVEGAHDEQTKDAILRYATESIFSQQRTGYLSKEPDSSPAQRFTELVTSTVKRES